MKHTHPCDACGERKEYVVQHIGRNETVCVDCLVEFWVQHHPKDAAAG